MITINIINNCSRLLDNKCLEYKLSVAFWCKAREQTPTQYSYINGFKTGL